jgi:hypothetical protein
MRWVPGALLGLSLAACYAPKVVGGAPCDPANEDSCPLGQTCETRSDGSFCSGGTRPDGGATGDAAGSFCLGNHLIGKQCAPAAPDKPLAITGVYTINTASTNPGNCSEVRPQTGGPPLCLVFASAIDIPAGATLRAAGPNPLVLFAAKTISVAGTVDVSGHVNLNETLPAEAGAGARSKADCAAATIDGTKSDGKNNKSNAGGGAAGGSFGSLGGQGGQGRGNIAGGKPVMGAAQTVLTGGCPGGGGGAGSDGGGEGLAGAGGGAVYLLAGEMITVAGAVNASGSGGGGGRDGIQSSGGGGGGGSGGMIALEAPKVMAPGQLFANGGGGGGGGGNDPARHGRPGGDGLNALVPAALGAGGDGGGGDGAKGAVLALVGASGSNTGTDNCAGGGGGGGVGVIHVYGDPAPTLGTISPPQS